MIILFAIQLPLLAGSADRLLRVKADSIYKRLSSKEKDNHYVWVKLKKEKPFPGKLPPVGGVYLQHLDADITNSVPEHLAIALQTDIDFNPIGRKKMFPGMNTLSSITDRKVLMDYLSYLRAELRARNIDHLILPPGKEIKYLASFLEIVHDFDPVFFIYYEDLVFDPPTKRKEFYPFLDREKRIVIDSDQLTEYKKTFRKGPKRYEPDKHKMLHHLAHLLKKPEPIKNEKPIVHRLWMESVTLYEKQNILPVRGDTIAVWVSNENTALFENISKYYPVVLNLKYDRIPSGVPVLIDARYNIFQASEYAYALQEMNPVIWVSSPGTLVNVNARAYLLTPEIHEQHDEILSHMVYGAESIRGFSKVPLPEFMSEYERRVVPGQQIISFGKAEWLGMDPVMLDSIDFHVEEMIKKHAAPGCQVLVVKEGKIVFDRSYGFLTYDSLIKVGSHTLYDIASVTKVSTTLLAIMKLVDDGILHPDSTLAHYLTDFRETNKQHITLRQLMVHQGGLQSYIPFWRRTLNVEGLEAFYYRSQDAKENDVRSYGYHPHPVMKDSLLSWIRNSGVEDDPVYRYSDIGFMILHQVVERVTGQTLEQYAADNFYQPLSLERTTFNPLNKGFELYHIAPTEYDYYFREEQVWGYVHDRNAAILGGVAGHAGLFSTSKDLAVILQMLLQNGNYGGHAFLSRNVINSFNQYQFRGNRRGLGWDKPGVFNPGISKRASDRSFGHSGFTGTMVWADPEEDLIYVFLSNRIFPDSNNWKINQLDTRRKIHDLIYRSLTSY